MTKPQGLGAVTQVTVADRVVALLADYGVSVMFSQSLPTMLVLAGQDAGIRQVVYRTENAAGAMADGFARISGRVGVVCAQNGPAAALLVAPLAEALKSSVPVVALVQEVPRAQADKNAFQELDHVQLFAACTKWARVLSTASRVDDYVRQAITIATTGRPGPVALMLPADVLLELVDDLPLPPKSGLGQWPLDRPVADQQQVARAAELISGATAPLVIAGGGVHSSRAADALARLQELAHLPVGTTVMGKGSAAESHPLTVGVLGNVMGRGSSGHHLKSLVREADVVVFVGTRSNQNGTDSWSLFPPDAVYIHIDVDGIEVGRNYPAVRLVGDARATLESLAEALELEDLTKRYDSRRSLEQRIAAARNDAAIESADARLSSASPMRPERMMHELEQLTSSDSIVVADASYSTVWVAAYLTAKTAGMRFVTPRGLAGLGWGLPMAIGAKLADPDKNVVCLTGDGGFGHVWSELETLVREQIPVVVIVLNNGVLGFQKDGEHVKFGRHTDACFFHDVDHAAVARAAGCDGVRVSDADQFGPALKAAIESNRPVLIDVVTDPHAYPPLTMFDEALDRAHDATRKAQAR